MTRVGIAPAILVQCVIEQAPSTWPAQHWHGTTRAGRAVIETVMPHAAAIDPMIQDTTK